VDPASNEDTDYNGYGVRVGAGLKYFPVPAMSLNAGVGYQVLKVTGDPAPGVERTLRASDFGINLGLSVYLGR
jgi:hypothetical protein